MRRFELHRDIDISGVSGCGIVAQGVVADSGKVALFWRGQYPSVDIKDSMEHVVAIHCHGGLTRVVWLDSEDGLLIPKPYNAHPRQVAITGAGSRPYDEGTQW